MLLFRVKGFCGKSAAVYSISGKYLSKALVDKNGRVGSGAFSYAGIILLK